MLTRYKPNSPRVPEAGNAGLRPTISIVDGDADLRGLLSALLRAGGFAVDEFSSGADLLETLRPGGQGCLVLDIDLAEPSGLEVQRTLAERGIDLPVIFLGERGDVSKARAAFLGGAADFLEKPVDAEMLLEAIRHALAPDPWRSPEQAPRRRSGNLGSLLTPREREVLALIAQGHSAKEAGRALGISHRTVEIHRACLMKKLKADSLADLVALAIRLGLRTEDADRRSTAHSPAMAPSEQPDRRDRRSMK